LEIKDIDGKKALYCNCCAKLFILYDKYSVKQHIDRKNHHDNLVFWKQDKVQAMEQLVELKTFAKNNEMQGSKSVADEAKLFRLRV